MDNLLIGSWVYLDECLNTNSMIIENTRRHIIPLLNKAHTYASRLPHLQPSSRIVQHEYLIPDQIQPVFRTGNFKRTCKFTLA